MGVVKYSGPIASFHCPTEATIRSLKVHFSPKQLGEGTPSPENVREIEGWDGVVTEKSGKNLWGGSAMKEAIINNFPIVSTDNNIVTYSNGGAAQADGAILFSSFKSNTQYTLVLTYSKSTNVYTHIAFLYSDGSFTMHNRVAPDNPNTKTTEVYVSKANKTLAAIVRKADEYSNVTLYCDESGLFEGIITKSEFESYRGETVDYEFGTLGKNKFDYANANIKNNKRLDDSGNETKDPYASYSQLYTPVVPSTQYTISGFLAPRNSQKRLYYFDKNKTFISRSIGYSQTTANPFTIITPENCYYVQIQLVNDVDGDAGWDTLQLELGSTATAYEPYDPNKTVYGGWVDLVRGEVCEEKRTVELNGSESKWYYYKENTYDRAIFVYSDTLGILSDNYFLSNIFGTQISGNQLWHGFTSVYNKWFQLNVDVDEFANVNEWKTYLSEHPLKICYSLPEPVIYHLAPTSMQTFLSANNVWSNADYVEVEYDLHETQSILARKQFIIANQPHVEKLAAAPLQSFETDMVAPLKECKVHFEPKQDLNGYDKPWVGGSGNNIWDEEWEVGRFDTTTGENISSSQIRSKNYIPVIPNTEYRFVGPTSIWIIPFDENKNVLSEQYFENATATSGNSSTFNSNSIFTTPTNCYFIKFYLLVGYGVTYNNDIAINYPSSVTTYSPYENICPIEGWNAIDLHKSGKNLLCLPIMTRTVNGITWTVNEDGSIQVDGTASANSFMSNWRDDTQHVDFYLKAGTYVLSRNGTPPVASMYLTARDGSITKDIGIVNTTKNSTTFTLEQDILVSFQVAVTPYQGEIHTIIRPQLELLSLTDYEAPNNSVIPITFPSEAGTIYGGYVDLVTGEIIKNWNFYTITGEEAFLESGNWISVFVPSGMQASNDASLRTAGFCSHYPYRAYSRGKIGVMYNERTITLDGSMRDAAGWKAYCQEQYNNGTPITLCYPLRTPIHYSIDPQTLKSLRGTNNIWSNANGPVSISYWTH